MENAALLPVTLTEWQGEAAAKQILLSWVTDRESGARDFTIERSGDGTIFTPIGEVAASDNSSEQKDYTLFDTDPTPDTKYYRLLQRDLDGSQTYSGVLAVNLGRASRLTPTIQLNSIERAVTGFTGWGVHGVGDVRWAALPYKIRHQITAR